MLSDEQWQELLVGFLAEGGDLLQRIEDTLGQLDDSPGDTEAINELFRAVHTLKGSAGLLGLTRVVAFTHDFENVLMGVRDGSITLDGALRSLAYKCMDHLALLIEAVAEGTMDDPRPERAQALGEALKAYLPATTATASSPAPSPAVERMQRSSDSHDCWHLSLRFPRDFFRMGFDPASFLKYLGRLGEVRDVLMLTDSFPDRLEDYDPEACYLGLEVELQSAADKAEIADVFEFVRDVAELHILPPQSRIDDYVRLIRALPETDERLGQILVQQGVVTAHELEQALGLQSSSPQAKKLGECFVEQAAAAPEVVQAALDKQKRRKPAEQAFLRIPAGKLDTLINQVGELVIAAAGAQLLAGERSDPELSERIDTVHQHVEMIRESALQLRMVEIGETFNRFHRVVRETSESLGKRIRLEIQGADTELDKTLVDKIHDPLVHLVRNAIDHGIEPEAERLACEKPAEGRVSLNAYYESGVIVIEVSDDGRGINVDKVRRKALESGVIQEDDTLDEQELLQLIFHPGLSTAGEVSNISGRGVGMDSVRQDIDALRGSVEIDNHPGAGCCLRIRLPLTLAIIDGFLVSVGDQYFVIPSDWVVECVEAPMARQDHEQGVMALRGKPLPYVTLREKFAIAGACVRRQSLVVCSHGQEKAGLLVDTLHGEIQTVIKPLGALFDHLPGVAGGTILGSGRVALTLDVPSLMASIRTHSHTTVSIH
ncbi:chemotaxis protein CheA [Marinobacteraceae bacterium S3BR75-40.1]